MSTRAPQLHPEVVALLERASTLTHDEAEALSNEWVRCFAAADRSVPGALSFYCAAPLFASEAALDAVWQRAADLDPDAPWTETWTIARTAVQAAAAALATVLEKKVDERATAQALYDTLEWAPDDLELSDTQLAERTAMDRLYARATRAWRVVIGQLRDDDDSLEHDQPYQSPRETQPARASMQKQLIEIKVPAMTDEERRRESAVDDMLRARPGRLSFGQWAARSDEQGWRYRALAS